MLSRAEEDKFIEDGSAKIEDIVTASSLDDVYLKFRECISRLMTLNLNTLDVVTRDDFTDPGEDDVEFILPLTLRTATEDEDETTNLCLIFNYSLENGVYSIFADVDFFFDEIDEALMIQE